MTRELMWPILIPAPKVALLPKENRGDAVNGSIILRFGTSESLVGKSTAAQFAARMLDKGTKTMTRQEIQDKLDALKAKSKYIWWLKFCLSTYRNHE
ncbi:MAG: hypothetical protein R2766_09170 [Saprospiraceae bacterium]